ncbi:hypothetical protein HMPREF9498_02114 [Enterococcus faecalis TX4248]|uniref:Uncharacterized protein n=1 Tax=Enterococcus faecalis TX4248 TaxID=749495 RepID=A0A125W4P4_ENTFL
MVGLFSLKNFSWLNRFIPVNGARFLLQKKAYSRKVQMCYTTQVGSL